MRLHSVEQVAALNMKTEKPAANAARLRSFSSYEKEGHSFSSLKFRPFGRRTQRVENKTQQGRRKSHQSGYLYKSALQSASCWFRSVLERADNIFC